jgi:hypothetical protein
MMSDKNSDHEREHDENDNALFAWSQDKHAEEPFHFVA